MPEIKNIQMQSVDEPCPVCKQGYMRPTGVTLMSNPPQYPHKCTKCQYEQTYSMRYPYIIGQ